MKIIARRGIIFVIDAIIVLAAIGILLVNGLNFGVDFTGGTLLERGFERSVTIQEVQDALASDALSAFDLGQAQVRPLEGSAPEQSIMLIRTRAFETQAPIAAIDAALAERFGEVVDRRTELVGPVIGRELVNQALLALAIAGAGILIYITLRFEYRFGIASIAALLHDVLIAIGVLALLGREINTPFIAAILTVVGYSINATIVIFDRIRENLDVTRGRSLADIADLSIRQTLARSINTSLTTLLVLVTLYIFGGSSIKDFTLTLLVGVVAGTFSSIFLSSPIWYVLRTATDKGAAVHASN